MKETYKDTDLREALRRRYSDTPKLPADFMMKTVQQVKPKASKPTSVIRRWRWIAAAACIFVIIGIGMRFEVKQPMQQAVPDKSLQVTAHAVQDPKPINPDTHSSSTSIPPTNVVSIVRTEPTQGLKRTERKTEQNKQITTTHENIYQEEPVNLHYATQTLTEDSTYQAPSRIDEFIAKLADYNMVKAVAIDCKSGTGDSTIVSTAYVFDDKKELDLFGRLLQVACWYDTNTPGFLLNFSRQQFFFSLKDLRKGEKYLWIAERINGQRILLFSVHSPIDTNISSACFQDYREQLTNTNIHTLF